jgi:hypothetical protein
MQDFDIYNKDKNLNLFPIMFKRNYTLNIYFY